MLNNRNMTKQKGFTLIELMIVVAIIGILAAIAIPQFSAYRVKAFNSAAESDLRNLMTLYKHLRWRIGKVPVFISGGKLGRAALREVLEGGDPAGVIQLGGLLTGKEPVPAASLETHLLRWLTHRMRRRGMAAAGTGTILEYLWTSYVEARNLSVIFQGVDLDPDTLRKELVQ